MRFCVLGSGSKGNAVLVDAGGTLVLVDCGYSAKEIRKRMSDVGCDLTDLDALVITHGHGDHVKGARKIASGMNLLTYATDDTVTFCARRSGLLNHARVVPGVPFRVSKTLEVTAFSTPHDAKGSVGFVFDDGHARLGFCTDLGAPDLGVIEALRDVDAMYLEFNYDAQMLQHGPYPAHLKRRVASRYGHLSNDDAARLLRAAKSKRLRRVVLAHLSEVNNTPRLALAAATSVLGDDVEVQVGPQHAPSVWFSVGDENAAKVARLPSRENLVDTLSRRESPKSPPYGIHAAAIGAADERAMDNATEVGSAEASTADAGVAEVGGAPGRFTHARAAAKARARARAQRLFGDDKSAPQSQAAPSREFSVRVLDATEAAAVRETPPNDVRKSPNRASSSTLALRLAKRAAEQRQAEAPEAENKPSKRSPPSTPPVPSSKRRKHPMIAVTRQLNLFGGAGE